MNLLPRIGQRLPPLVTTVSQLWKTVLAHLSIILDPSLPRPFSPYLTNFALLRFRPTASLILPTLGPRHLLPIHVLQLAVRPLRHGEKRICCPPRRFHSPTNTPKIRPSILPNVLFQRLHTICARIRVRKGSLAMDRHVSDEISH